MNVLIKSLCAHESTSQGERTVFCIQQQTDVFISNKSGGKFDMKYFTFKGDVCLFLCLRSFS